MKVPLVKLCIDEEEVEAVNEVLRSGWLLQGPRVRELERQLELFFGVKHAVCVSSCTAALHLSVLSLGFSKVDEVVCPDFTFPASANAIIHGGASPVFADVSSYTYTLHHYGLKQAITPQTKAVMHVHLFGNPYLIDEVSEIAGNNGLALIYDAAGAFGAEYKGRKIGSSTAFRVLNPLFTCFSFDTRKILTMGEGGVILTNDDEKADWLRMSRSHGSNLETWKIHQSPSLRSLQFPISGLNYRMTEIQAAIGLVQLEKLPWILARRRKVAQLYDKLLNEIDGILPPYVSLEAASTYQSYVVTLPNMNNTRFIEEMRKRGVQATYASRAL
ncbi:MAG: DegT/DnrJ/EryC1/StrS family aminotransferase, partial [Candidatus Bathyarchaeia archaeon]